MRNMMVTVSSEDYVTVAQAKGLKERRVMSGYASRNAILPQVSSFALSLGFVVGGTLIMEMVFSYQGIGYVLFTAVGSTHDYPLMQGVLPGRSPSPSSSPTCLPTSSTPRSTRGPGRRADMAVDLTLLEDTPRRHHRGDHHLAASREFVFLRNRKSLTGFVILAILRDPGDHRPVDRAVRPERDSAPTCCSRRAPSTGSAPTSWARTSCRRSRRHPQRR